MTKNRTTDSQKKRKQSKKREEIVVTRSFRQWKALYHKWIARDKRRYYSS